MARKITKRLKNTQNRYNDSRKLVQVIYDLALNDNKIDIDIVQFEDI
jgi:hypothetical protein